MINTVDASVGNAFSEVQVRQLPLMTRNVVELLSLQPGVTPTGEVVGARRDQNNITLDGVDVNDNQNAGIENPTQTPSQGGLNHRRLARERLQRRAAGAARLGAGVPRHGRGAERQPGAQLRRPGDARHQERHEPASTDRPTSTTATPSSRRTTGSATAPALASEQLKRNQYGVSLGGPIVATALFFFGNVERRNDDSARDAAAHGAVGDAARRARSWRARATARPTRSAPTHPAGRSIRWASASTRRCSTSSARCRPATTRRLGLDNGLNFAGFRFNAPMTLDNRAYVVKMDVQAGLRRARTTCRVRAHVRRQRPRTRALAQYPGQDPTAHLLNNSYGVSASYTGVLSPNLDQRRQLRADQHPAWQRTGTLGPSFTHRQHRRADRFHAAVRARARPTYNFIDDLTWNEGRRTTCTMGGNLRVVRNDRTNYGNAFPSYSYQPRRRCSASAPTSSRRTQTTTWRADRQLDDPPDRRAVRARARFGDLFGVITSGSMTYSYDRDGNPLPIGDPTIRNFASNEFELYFGDNWRVTPNLTLTYGVRYMNLGVPYETQRPAGGADLPAAGVLRGAPRRHGGGHPEQPAAAQLMQLRLQRSGERQGQLVRAATTTTSRRAWPSPTRRTAASSAS